MLTVRFLLETMKSEGILDARVGDEAKILNSGEDSSRESSLSRGRCNLTLETFPPWQLLPLPRLCDIVDPSSSSLLDEIVLELELELSWRLPMLMGIWETITDSCNLGVSRSRGRVWFILPSHMSSIAFCFRILNMMVVAVWDESFALRDLCCCLCACLHVCGFGADVVDSKRVE